MKVSIFRDFDDSINITLPDCGGVKIYGTKDPVEMVIFCHALSERFENIEFSFFSKINPKIAQCFLSKFLLNNKIERITLSLSKEEELDNFHVYISIDSDIVITDSDRWFLDCIAMSNKDNSPIFSFFIPDSCIISEVESKLEKARKIVSNLKIHKNAS